MRILDWLSGLIGPRHTFESVALGLARRLEDGSIVNDVRPIRLAADTDDKDEPCRPPAAPTNGHPSAAADPARPASAVGP